MTPFEHANSQALDKARTASNIDGAKKLNKAAGTVGLVAAGITLWAPNPVSASVAVGAGAVSLTCEAYLVKEGEVDGKEALFNVVADKIPVGKLISSKWANEITFGYQNSNNLNTDMNSTSILDF
jgi:hypothetical protein